jgi:hypothetical protein
MSVNLGNSGGRAASWASITSGIAGANGAFSFGVWTRSASGNWTGSNVRSLALVSAAGPNASQSQVGATGFQSTISAATENEGAPYTEWIFHLIRRASSTSTVTVTSWRDIDDVDSPYASASGALATTALSRVAIATNGTAAQGGQPNLDVARAWYHAGHLSDADAYAASRSTAPGATYYWPLADSTTWLDEAGGGAALTAGGTGTVTNATGEPPVIAGSVIGELVATLGALVGSASGVSTIKGEVSATLGALTASSTGVAPRYAQAALQLGALTVATTGALRLTGAVSAVLGPCTVVASGGIPDPDQPPPRFVVSVGAQSTPPVTCSVGPQPLPPVTATIAA